MSDILKTPTAITPCRRMGLSRNTSKNISPAVLSPVIIATNQIVVDVTPKSTIPRTVCKCLNLYSTFIYYLFILHSWNPSQPKLLRLKRGNYLNKLLALMKMKYSVHRSFRLPGSLCPQEAIDIVYRLTREFGINFQRKRLISSLKPWTLQRSLRRFCLQIVWISHHAP